MNLRKIVGSRPLIMVGACVLLIDQHNRILLQLRKDNNCWGLPGGSMELGETIEETASRELKEETGLISSRFELIDVFSGPLYYFRYPNGDETYSVIHLYRANGVKGTLEMNDGESINLQYFSKEALPKDIEKRALALINHLGDQFWDLQSSFED